ncbi:MAG: hypothetical protein ACE5FE_05415, partial [Acidiferrobacterales bacterium]
KIHARKSFLVRFCRPQTLRSCRRHSLFSVSTTICYPINSCAYSWHALGFVQANHLRSLM